MQFKSFVSERQAITSTVKAEAKKNYVLMTSKVNMYYGQCGSVSDRICCIFSFCRLSKLPYN